MIPRRLPLAQSLHRASSRPLQQHIRQHINLRTTARNASSSSNSTSNRAKNFVYGTFGVLLVTGGYFYLTDTRASIHKYTVPTLLRWLYDDAEEAHKLGIDAMKELYSLGLHPRERGTPDQGLAVKVFGETLTNPIGISGGLDKHADIPDALFALGPSIVELGGITAHPQDGNLQPRVFRIPTEKALINRYGLPSEGADVVAMRLRQRVREYAYNAGFGLDEEAERVVLDGYAGVPPGSLHEGRLLAVQVAKNKATPDADLDAVVEDHVYCVKQLGPYADIIVVNVSSPNTPGLRAFQSRAPLTKILSAVVDVARAVPRRDPPKVMVKVSPDEDSAAQVKGICDAVWASGVDGVIVGNTTKFRPESSFKENALPPNEAQTIREQGGFSGPHLFDRTLHLVRMYRTLLDQGPNNHTDPDPAPKFSKKPSPSSGSESEADGAAKSSTNIAETKVKTAAKSISNKAKKAFSPTDHKVIFASGGITNGTQALQVLDAGASVAMVYTALVYGGAGTISEMKDEMKARLIEQNKA